MGKRKKNAIRVQGWDLSLNHCGMVELVNGKLGRFWYATDKKGSFKRNDSAVMVPARGKHEETSIFEVRRLEWWEEFFKFHIKRNGADYVGIEGYSMNSAQGSHQIGELGGIARLACWKEGIPLRVHDPLSVKMFAAHNGHATKPMVENAVLDRWGASFSKCNPPENKGKVNRQTSEDLADAFVIAKLVWYEVCLRSGLLLLSDLHAKEIQVFNRTSRGYPVNILGREWVHAKRS